MARVRHGQEDWISYHITTRTIGGAFYLARESDKRPILQALSFYRQRGDYRLYGFVIMCNHVHFIIHPLPDVLLEKIVDGFKTWTSRRNTSKPGRELWERRYDDNRVKTVGELRKVLEYIHVNPVRAGIVAEPGDYPWSSFHNYAGDKKALIEIDTDWWEG